MTDKQRKEALEALETLDGVVAQVTGLARPGVLTLMAATATIKAALKAKPVPANKGKR